jgi:hypothetical protein
LQTASPKFIDLFFAQAQRQNSPQSVSFFTMMVSALLPETKVASALDLGSEVPRVFTSHRTACVGCSMARFCTLRDVATIYGLQIGPLLLEMQRAAGIQKPNSGAKNA